MCTTDFNTQISLKCIWYWEYLTKYKGGKTRLTLCAVQSVFLAYSQWTPWKTKVLKSWRRSHTITRLVLCLPYGSVWQTTAADCSCSMICEILEDTGYGYRNMCNTENNFVYFISLKLNGTHQLLAYADDVNIMGGSIHTLCRSFSSCY